MWVLLIDDEPYIARTLLRALRPRLGGKSLLTVQTIDDMLEVLSRYDAPPRAILLDYQLVASNGVQALKAIRQRGVHTRCAFYSSVDPSEIYAELEHYGIEERPPCFGKTTSLDALLKWLLAPTEHTASL